MAPWSEQIARRYAVRLPDDVVDLIDSGHWQDEPWDGSFNQILDPQAIWNGSAIWGGAMLPDTLPIINNGCGDVLCLRFSSDGRVRDVIAWWHEDDYWAPCGRSLVEAVANDVSGALDISFQTDQQSEQPKWFGEWLTRWNGAGKQLQERPEPVGAVLETECRRRLWTALDDACLRLGGEAIREQLGRPAWTASLLRLFGRRPSGTAHARTYEEFAAWCMDTSKIPLPVRDQLARLLKIPVNTITEQDWAGAERIASTAGVPLKELAWPHAVLGYAAGAPRQLRRGDPALRGRCPVLGHLRRIHQRMV